jgi:glycosyltransferase involved in cell wall biosynthesis
MEKLSVIIPTLNEELYLPIVLRSLISQTECEIEVIVVDGKSEDRTVAETMRVAYENRNPNISIRTLVSERRQVSYQRNLGAKSAKHEVLLFLDADTTVLSPDSLAERVRLFQSRRLQAATFRLKSLERRKAADAYYFIFWVFTNAMERFKPYASGACLMTTREAFKKVGGFDETIFINEDGDYCRRVKKFGKFAVLRPAFYTSCRRFDRMGYWKAGRMYVRIAIARLIRGELKDPRKFDYNFGDFDKDA